MDILGEFDFKSIYQEHLRLRNQSLHKLKLPFANLRKGQKDLLLKIATSLTKRKTFILNAPTGFGKTFVCLVPALAALAKGKIKRIYYFTNQESQRILPVNLLNELRELNDLQLWTQIIYSIERLCRAHEFCYLHNNKKLLKLTAQRLLASFNGQIDFTTLQEWAKTSELCPYLLQMELAKYVDLIILDYNYLFDPLKQLKELKDSQANLALLLDEAHNIPRRGQEIYQVKINLQDFVQYESLLNSYLKGIDVQNWQKQSQDYFMNMYNCLAKIIQQIKDLAKLCAITQPVSKDSLLEYLHVPSEDLLISQTHLTCKVYARHKLPELSNLLINFSELFSTFSKTEQSKLVSNYHELQQLNEQINNLKRLQYLLTNYSASFIFGLSWQLRNKKLYANLMIYCLDAMPLLLESIPKAASKIFFSATLLPLDYYAKMFTEDFEKAEIVSASSPFSEENRRVAVISYADLSYKHREVNAKLVAKSLLAYLKKRKGHLLVFAPSYSYLSILEHELIRIFPSNYRLLVQKKQANLQTKQAFINTLKDVTDERPLLALAVLQSSFSEGLDLPGNCISAVAIISAALPAKSDLLSLQYEYFQKHFVSHAMEQMDNQIMEADYYEQATSSASRESALGHRQANQAYFFTQIYPSFSKIVQACGRLIRSENDKGEIMLFDERFTRDEYQPLLQAAFGDYSVLADLEAYVDWLNTLPTF